MSSIVTLSIIAALLFCSVASGKVIKAADSKHCDAAIEYRTSNVSTSALPLAVNNSGAPVCNCNTCGQQYNIAGSATAYIYNRAACGGSTPYAYVDALKVQSYDGNASPFSVATRPEQFSSYLYADASTTPGYLFTCYNKGSGFVGGRSNQIWVEITCGNARTSCIVVADITLLCYTAEQYDAAILKASKLIEGHTAAN